MTYKHAVVNEARKQICMLQESFFVGKTNNKRCVRFVLGTSSHRTKRKGYVIYLKIDLKHLSYLPDRILHVCKKYVAEYTIDTIMKEYTNFIPRFKRHKYIGVQIQNKHMRKYVLGMSSYKTRMCSDGGSILNKCRFELENVSAVVRKYKTDPIFLSIPRWCYLWREMVCFILKEFWFEHGHDKNIVKMIFIYL
jgi:hypothetical protein